MVVGAEVARIVPVDNHPNGRGSAQLQISPGLIHRRLARHTSVRHVQNAIGESRYRHPVQRPQQGRCIDKYEIRQAAQLLKRVPMWSEESSSNAFVEGSSGPA